MPEEIKDEKSGLPTENDVPPLVVETELAVAKKKVRFWMIISGSCLLLAMVLAAISFAYFLNENPVVAKNESKQEEPSLENGEPDITGLVRRAIDGVYVEPGKDNPYPIAVAIDNHADARPPFGLAQANFVIEAEAEGGITRYLAFFASGNDIDEIGPVRSARPYFADWASEYSALYVHVGGSPDALAKMAKENILHINEFYNGEYFWRTENRSAPHNVLTSTDKLSEYLLGKDLSQGKFIGSRFKDENPVALASSTRIAIGYLIPEFKVVWNYDSVRNSYIRSLGGTEHKTADGKNVIAKNVVIQYVKAKVLDGALRQEMEHIGKGDAVICRDGACMEGVWQKKDATARTRFYMLDGVEFEFNAGVTWINVIEPGYEVEY